MKNSLLNALVDKSNIDKNAIKKYIEYFENHYKINAEIFTLSVCGIYTPINGTEKDIEKFLNNPDAKSKIVKNIKEHVIKTFPELENVPYEFEVTNFDFPEQLVWANIISEDKTIKESTTFQLTMFI